MLIFALLFANVAAYAYTRSQYSAVFSTRLTMASGPFSFFSPKPTASPKSFQKSVAVTGASGLVGPAVAAAFEAKGYNVIKLTTRDATDKPNTIKWNPSNGILDGSFLEGVDVVVNLAGENIASGEGPLAFLGRWSEAKKARVLKSRIDSTKLVVETILKLKTKPKVLISASGIGFYGYNDFNKVFDESVTAPGDGFLSQVCQEWEAEANKAKAAGVRVACTRFASVLSPRGGVLAKLLPIFSLGVGGDFGNGKQPFSWVSLDDVASAIVFVAENNALSGPINVCAPDSDLVTNSVFTKSLGSALGRPTFLPVPELAAKLAFGQFGEELLLGGQRASPKKLTAARFQFKDTDILLAMPSILERK